MATFKFIFILKQKRGSLNDQVTYANNIFPKGVKKHAA